jgi:hypothetical protein
MAEENRRSAQEFDGLLGTLSGGVPVLLNDLLRHIRDYLIEQCGSETRVRSLAREHEPRVGYSTRTPISDDVAFALDLLASIASAARCPPSRRDKLLFGEVGATGAKVRRGLNKANAVRETEASRHDSDLQRLASEKWSQAQHAGKSASAIARLIDPEHWRTTRKKIWRP